MNFKAVLTVQHWSLNLPLESRELLHDVIKLTLRDVVILVLKEQILRTHERSELVQDVIQFALRGLILSIHGSCKLLQDLIRAALNEPILRNSRLV